MRIAIIHVLLLTFVINTQAQELQQGVVDKVIAIVGDRIILQSDITSQKESIKAQGHVQSSDAECMIIEQAMISKILMLQGEKDSLITDEYVEDYLDRSMKALIKNQDSDNCGGLTDSDIIRIRKQSFQSLREGLIAEAMKEKIIENVRITPSEVEAYFNSIPKNNLPVIDFDPESRNAARHLMNLKDDYIRIAELALQEKRTKTFDSWFRTNIPKIYVEIDDRTQDQCEEIKKYITSSTKN